ncbi:MAG: hypothetical protein CMJ83_06555 [Planctomycetes bacterium]|nr:hypothetical protein [Planctomycetota bacterium]
MKCGKCRIESPLEEAFRRRDYRGAPPLCPPCFAQAWGLWSEVGKIINLGVWIALIIRLAVGAAAAFGPSPDGRLSIFSVCAAIPAAYVASLMLATVHECVHATAAWAVGGRVHAIDIGGGGALRSVRWWGVRWSWGRFPLAGGTCIYSLPPSVATRARHVVVVAAPSAMHLVLAAALLVIARTVAEPMSAMCDVLGLLNGWMFLLNTLPRQVSVGPLRAPNDGARIDQLIGSPGALLECQRAEVILRVQEAAMDDDHAVVAATAADEVRGWEPSSERDQAFAFCLFHARQWDQVLDWARDAMVTPIADDTDGRQQFLYGVPPPSCFPRAVLIAALFRSGRISESLAEAERQHDESESELTRALAASDLAYYLARYRRTPEVPARARNLAFYAFERLPWIDRIIGTFGITQIAEGDAKTGIEYLEQADRKGTIAEYVGMRAAWRAMGLAKLGRHAEAERQIAHARLLTSERELISAAEGYAGAVAAIDDPRRPDLEGPERGVDDG